MSFFKLRLSLPFQKQIVVGQKKLVLVVIATPRKFKTILMNRCGQMQIIEVIAELHSNMNV